MSQSQQDDNCEALETVVEQVSVFLTLNALQRKLTQEETWVLERVSRVLAQVHPARDVPALRCIRGQGA
jgi:hypothetical protein